MPKVTVEHKEEVRRRILDAAEACFFEKGHDRTTTRDILERAGISNGTLYHYFESKEELSAALVDRIAAGNTSFLTAAVERGSGDLSTVATILRTLLLRSNDDSLPSIRVRAAHDLSAREALKRYDRTMVDVMAPIVEAAKDRGHLRESLETAALIELVEIFFEGLRSHAAARTFVTSHKQVALTFLEVFAIGAAPVQPAKRRALLQALAPERSEDA
jgi:AcrR family transcriptional regulator